MVVPFIRRLWSEYPIPADLSVWGGDYLTTFPEADLEVLVESCVTELRSDLYMLEYAYAGSMQTQLPRNAFAVVSAKLAFGFQGNRALRFTFDRDSNMVFLRGFPAKIAYRRYLMRKDLDAGSAVDGRPVGLQGDQLQYAMMYVLWKMAEKEVVMIGSVNVEGDNASIDLSRLTSFAAACKDRYESLKDEILIYTAGF